MTLTIDSEVKIDTEPCVAAWDDVLFVGNEDGTIRSYDDKLTQIHSWAAHPVQVFAIAAGNGKVYSCSNDGMIKVWSPEGEKLAELQTCDADVGILRVHGNELYAGDEAGNVLVYEKISEKARYNVMEEVKGLAIDPPYLFTARDVDITVTEIKPDDSKTRYATRHTMEGRAPLVITENYFLAMARGGNDLCLYDGTLKTKYKKLCVVKASNMIITSLIASKNVAWTGGWDGRVQQWNINGDKLESAGDLNLGSCVNALILSQGCIVAILAGGRIVKIKCIE